MMSGVILYRLPGGHQHPVSFMWLGHMWQEWDCWNVGTDNCDAQWRADYQSVQSNVHSHSSIRSSRSSTSSPALGVDHPDNVTALVGIGIRCCRVRCCAFSWSLELLSVFPYACLAELAGASLIKDLSLQRLGGLFLSETPHPSVKPSLLSERP